MQTRFLLGTLGLFALGATLLGGEAKVRAATANGPICDPNARVNSTTQALVQTHTPSICVMCCASGGMASVTSTAITALASR